MADEEPEIAVEEEQEEAGIAGGESVEIVESTAPSSANAGVGLSIFEDHFSLPAASSTVRFRKTMTTSRIYPGADSQFVIQDDIDEQTGARHVRAMHVSDSTSGLKGLRLAYTLVCAFWVSRMEKH